MDSRLPEPLEKRDAGKEFIKNIRPAGCALFLLLAVLVFAVCMTAGKDPIPDYQAPDPSVYANDLPRLVQELEENVLPKLPQYDISASITGDTVTLKINSGNFAAARAAILRYFPEEYFTFERG